MSLRPRYSLLTLLVLTALVAGGVKLWYGPHHVVERRGDNGEVEYDFIRLWSREKIRQGPFIMRIYQDNKLSAVEIRYFRDDLKLPWSCHMRADAQGPVTVEFFELSTMTPVETEQLQKAIAREQERFLAQGSLLKKHPQPSNSLSSDGWQEPRLFKLSSLPSLAFVGTVFALTVRS